MSIKIERNGKSLASMKTADLEKVLTNADKRRKHANVKKLLAKRGNQAKA